MGYKFKPNKSVAKRMRVTRTGKLKRSHGFHSHLMSARPSSKRRKIRRAAVLFEGHARNMRQLMGISALRPGKIRHERELADMAEEAEKTEKTAAAPKAKAAALKTSGRK